MKPCGSLCSATVGARSRCGGALEALGLAQDCVGMQSQFGIPLYDYTSAPQSSLANHTGVSQFPLCNDMSSTAVRRFNANLPVW